MDFDAMAKSLMPDWLYNFFSGSGGEKVTEDLFASGGFIDDFGANSINEDEIRKMIDATSGDDQKKLMNQLVAAYQDNTANLESAEQEKKKAEAKTKVVRKTKQEPQKKITQKF